MLPTYIIQKTKVECNRTFEENFQLCKTPPSFKETVIRNLRKAGFDIDRDDTLDYVNSTIDAYMAKNFLDRIQVNSNWFEHHRFKFYEMDTEDYQWISFIRLENDYDWQITLVQERDSAAVIETKVDCEWWITRKCKVAIQRYKKSAVKETYSIETLFDLNCFLDDDFDLINRILEKILPGGDDE
jgi:hypothetical protein